MVETDQPLFPDEGAWWPAREVCFRPPECPLMVAGLGLRCVAVPPDLADALVAVGGEVLTRESVRAALAALKPARAAELSRTAAVSVWITAVWGH